MDTRLLVDGIDDSGLVTLFGSQRAKDIDLETLDNLVLNLDLVFDDVAGGPGVGEGHTVSLVGPLGFNITDNGGRARRTTSSNLERNIGRSFGFNLETVTSVGEVLAEQVVRGLSKVLEQ